MKKSRHRRAAAAPDAVAFHEAAHAVVAAVLGRGDHVQVVYASAKPEKYGVRTRWRGGSEEERAATQAVLAIVDMAGVIGELRHLRENAWLSDARNASARCVAVVRARRGLPADAPVDELRVAARQLFDELRGKAETLVAEYWPEIRRVAAALAERGELSGAEIEGLVREPSP